MFGKIEIVLKDYLFAVFSSIQELTCGFSNRRKQLVWGHFKETEIACINNSGIPKQSSKGRFRVYF